jgi:transposase
MCAGTKKGGQAIEREVQNCPEARRLMTHPGVGALTALGFVLIIGNAERFGCGKQVASYLGLVPLEDSSGNRRRLGHITKQGSSVLRFCWWKRRRSRCAACQNGAAGISTFSI